MSFLVPENSIQRKYIIKLDDEIATFCHDNAANSSWFFLWYSLKLRFAMVILFLDIYKSTACFFREAGLRTIVICNANIMWTISICFLATWYHECLSWLCNFSASLINKEKHDTRRYWKKFRLRVPRSLILDSFPRIFELNMSFQSKRHTELLKIKLHTRNVQLWDLCVYMGVS